jgi:hypothetical protein
LEDYPCPGLGSIETENYMNKKTKMIFMLKVITKVVLIIGALSFFSIGFINSMITEM